MVYTILIGTGLDFFFICMYVCRSKFFFYQEKKHSQYFFKKLFFFVFKKKKKKKKAPQGPPSREGEGGVRGMERGFDQN